MRLIVYSACFPHRVSRGAFVCAVLRACLRVRKLACSAERLPSEQLNDSCVRFVCPVDEREAMKEALAEAKDEKELLEKSSVDAGQ